MKYYQIGCKYQSSEQIGKKSGMIFHEEEKTLILINRDEPPLRQRFTAMHELGHFLLGHLGEIPFSRSEEECRPAEEQAADKFAIDMLAPACVLWGMKIRTAEEIAVLCNISPEAARFRAERMKILYERERFLSHPLEKRVYLQFLPFIRHNRK